MVDLQMFLSLLAIVITVTWAKICCDQDCRKPISYGRTRDRYITQEEGHLSFPNAAIVTILGKNAATDTSGNEMWLAEIQGRKGLIPSGVVTELHTLCEPKHIIEESKSSQELIENDIASDSGYTSFHESYHSSDVEYLSTDIEYEAKLHQEQRQTIEEQKHGSIEKQVASVEEQVWQQHNSFNQPVNLEKQDSWVQQHDVSTEHKNTLGLPVEQDSFMEAPASHRAAEYTVNPSSQPNMDDDQHPQTPHELPIPLHSPNMYVSDQSSVPDQPEESALIQNLYAFPNSNGVEYDHNQLESVMDDTVQDTYQNGHTDDELFDSVDPIPTSSPLPMIHSHLDMKNDDPLTRDGPIHAAEEEAVSQSQIRWSQDIKTAEENLQNGQTESNTHEYIDEGHSNEYVEQTHTREQDEQTEQHEHVGHTQKSDSQKEVASESTILTTLNNDHVESRGDGRVEMTNSNGAVDNDYLYDIGVDELEYDYDDDGTGNDDENEEQQKSNHFINDVPTDNILVHEYEKHTSELPYKEMVGTVPSHSDPNPPDSDQQAYHHSYLDVNSLRQRFQDSSDSETPGIGENTETAYTSDTTQHVQDVPHLTEDVHHNLTPSVDHDESYLPIPKTTQNSHHDSAQMPLEMHKIQQLADSSYISPLDAEPTVQEFMYPDATNIPTASVLPQAIHDKENNYHSPLEAIHQEIRPIEHDEFPITDDDRLQEEEDSLISDAKYKMWIVDFIAEFSPSLASWIFQQGPAFGLIGGTTSFFAFFIPLCCSCCHYWKDSKKKGATITKQAASRKALEEQIQKFKSEKNNVQTEFAMLEERCGTLEIELETVQRHKHSLTEAKAEIEDNYRRTCSDLHSVQQELTKSATLVNQLRSELKHEQMQLSAQTSDKEVALQQIALLQGQMRECEQHVHELEAAKEQLEQNVFSIQNSHQQLEILHTQVSQELTDSKTENTELKSRHQSLQDEVSYLQQAKKDNEQEIQTLQNCLSQLMVSTASGVDAPQEDTDGDIQGRDSSEILLKIQAMLDTTKVQNELQAATEERDKAVAAFEKQTSLVITLQAENNILCDRIQHVESQLNECHTDLQKLQDKHKTLTEYFEQKEHNLHRMLGVEEAVRQAVETREAHVKERAESLEQTETKHREELKQLRSEMFEIEKSLMSQVHTCQKRAEEAIAEQRRLEQECKALKLEREDLKKRIAVSPSDRHRSLTVRPPSAPYLPRTSSPGVADSEDHDMTTSILSHTDPLPGPHPLPQGPGISNPEPPHFPPDRPREHSLPPFQGPLRHPIRGGERPRYPPPPSGRRMIRGYPPFDRRPPMPHPRAMYGPMNRYPHDMRENTTFPERRRPLSNPPPGARSTPPLVMYPHHHPGMPNSSAGFVPVIPAVPEPSTSQSQEKEQSAHLETV